MAGPYRTAERHRAPPRLDVESLASAALLALAGASPVVLELLSGASLGPASGVGALVAASGIGMVAAEARRLRRARQTSDRER